MEGGGAKPGRLRTYARSELLSWVGEAGSRVWLASPFLGRPVAAEIVACPSGDIDRRLLTALVAGSVQVGALDPEALGLLRSDGWEIRSIRNLHAKLSIVDASWGLVGSGNLTSAGLGGTDKGNLELGVVLGREQILAASSIYEGWWDEAGEVTDADIARFADLARQAPMVLEMGVGPMLEIPDPDGLRKALAEEAPGRRYWVKANYHRRGEDGKGWWHRDWIGDARRGSYRVGDLVLLYLGAAYEGPSCCPVVVEVTSESTEERDFVLEERDLDAAERWPYVTRTRCLFEIEVPRGVPLDLFGVDATGLQNGKKKLSREQFETAARFLLDAVEAS